MSFSSDVKEELMLYLYWQDMLKGMEMGIFILKYRLKT